jgi:hypothetical protein
MSNMVSEFITLESLGSFTVMVFVVALVVQFTKGFLKRQFSDYVVRHEAFVVALILVFAWNWYAGFFVGGASEIVLKVLLCVINGMLVALAAIGGYDVIADPRAEKELPFNRG